MFFLVHAIAFPFVMLTPPLLLIGVYSFRSLRRMGKSDDTARIAGLLPDPCPKNRPRHPECSAFYLLFETHFDHYIQARRLSESFVHNLVSRVAVAADLWRLYGLCHYLGSAAGSLAAASVFRKAFRNRPSMHRPAKPGPERQRIES
jgi:hypothetical protein